MVAGAGLASPLRGVDRPAVRPKPPGESGDGGLRHPALGPPGGADVGTLRHTLLGGPDHQHRAVLPANRDRPHAPAALQTSASPATSPARVASGTGPSSAAAGPDRKQFNQLGALTSLDESSDANRHAVQISTARRDSPNPMNNSGVLSILYSINLRGFCRRSPETHTATDKRIQSRWGHFRHGAADGRACRSRCRPSLLSSTRRLPMHYSTC